MDKIIVMYKKIDKIADISLYEFIENCYKYNSSFVVCHITEKEYEIMKQQIKDGKLNERKKIKQEEIEYNPFRWMIANDLENKCIKFADYNDFDQKGSFILKDDKLQYEKDCACFIKEYSMDKYTNGLKVYTTETYDDVITHYRVHTLGIGFLEPTPRLKFK